MALSLFPCLRNGFSSSRENSLSFSLSFSTLRANEEWKEERGVIILSFLLSVGGRNGWQQGKERKKEDGRFHLELLHRECFFFSRHPFLFFCESGKKPVVEEEGPENRISLDVK